MFEERLAVEMPVLAANAESANPTTNSAFHHPTAGFSGVVVPVCDAIRIPLKESTSCVSDASAPPAKRMRYENGTWSNGSTSPSHSEDLDLYHDENGLVRTASASSSSSKAIHDVHRHHRHHAATSSPSPSAGVPSGETSRDSHSSGTVSEDDSRIRAPLHFDAAQQKHESVALGSAESETTPPPTSTDVVPIPDDPNQLITSDSRFHSYAEFEDRFERWKRHHLHPFRVASSEALREPDGAINAQFRYRYVVFHCAHYGEPRMRGIGKRPNQNYLPCGCRAMLRLNFNYQERCLKITTLNASHNVHEVSEEMYLKVSQKIRRSLPQESNQSRRNSLVGKDFDKKTPSPLARSYTPTSMASGKPTTPGFAATPVPMAMPTSSGSSSTTTSAAAAAAVVAAAIANPLQSQMNAINVMQQQYMQQQMAFAAAQQQHQQHHQQHHQQPHMAPPSAFSSPQVNVLAAYLQQQHVFQQLIAHQKENLSASQTASAFAAAAATSAAANRVWEPTASSPEAANSENRPEASLPFASAPLKFDGVPRPPANLPAPIPRRPHELLGGVPMTFGASLQHHQQQHVGVVAPLAAVKKELASPAMATTPAATAVAAMPTLVPAVHAVEPENDENAHKNQLLAKVKTEKVEPQQQKQETSEVQKLLGECARKLSEADDVVVGVRIGQLKALLVHWSES